MATYYTIVRCVPDPVADERINIGVIVWGDGTIRSHFRSDWQRVKRFGLNDISFVREFAQRLGEVNPNQLALPDLSETQRFDEPALERAIDTWAGVIQFSAARASLRDPAIVLDDAVRRFLRSQRATAISSRGRRSAATLIQRRVEEALEQRVGDRRVGHFIRKNYDLAGRLEEHQVDVSVVNGIPHLAARGLSFEIQEVAEMRHHYTDTIYAVTDLKERLPDLPFGVVVFAPHRRATSAAVELYRKAVDVLPRAGAIVVDELEAAAWAREAVATIPEEAFGLLH